MITAEEAQQLLDAATPGPWLWEAEGFMGCGQVYTMGEHVMGGSIAAPSGDLYPRSGYSPKDDMLLIARTRELAETVIALYERLGHTGWGSEESGIPAHVKQVLTGQEP